MKKSTKKYIKTFGSAVLSTLLLFGCSKPESEAEKTEEPTTAVDGQTEQVEEKEVGIPGMYYPIAIEKEGEFIAVGSEESHSSAAPCIALNADGKGKIVIDGSYGNFKWTDKGDHLELVFENEETVYNFPYKDHILTMDQSEEGVIIYFGRDVVDYSAFLESEGKVTATPTTEAN